MDNNIFISFSATKKFDECDYYFKLVVRRAVKATLEYLRIESDAEVSVTFCDNAYIKELNKLHRNKDSATDVLSFPMYDFSSEDEEFPEYEPITLGDIVISI